MHERILSQCELVDQLSCKSILSNASTTEALPRLRAMVTCLNVN